MQLHSTTRYKLTHTYGGTPSKSKISTKKYKGITEDQALLDEYKIELYNERQKLANELLAKIVIGAQLNILLTFEEADSLLAMLNDRRMELGNKFNITEEDMVGRVPLDKPIGQALAEISMLSIFQELIINAL